MGQPSKVRQTCTTIAGLCSGDLSHLRLQVAGDPRNPDNVQPYEPPVPAEPTGDIIMMLGLGCAAFGLLTKVPSSLHRSSAVLPLAPLAKAPACCSSRFYHGLGFTAA